MPPNGSKPLKRSADELRARLAGQNQEDAKRQKLDIDGAAKAPAPITASTSPVWSAMLAARPPSAADAPESLESYADESPIITSEPWTDVALQESSGFRNCAISIDGGPIIGSPFPLQNHGLTIWTPQLSIDPGSDGSPKIELDVTPPSRAGRLLHHEEKIAFTWLSGVSLIEQGSSRNWQLDDVTYSTLDSAIAQGNFFAASKDIVDMIDRDTETLTANLGVTPQSILKMSIDRRRETIICLAFKTYGAYTRNFQPSTLIRYCGQAAAIDLAKIAIQEDDTPQRHTIRLWMRVPTTNADFMETHLRWIKWAGDHKMSRVE